jgi:hypothetical protein
VLQGALALKTNPGAFQNKYKLEVRRAAFFSIALGCACHSCFTGMHLVASRIIEGKTAARAVVFTQ